MGGAEAEWNSVNDRNIKLLVEFNRIRPRSSWFILCRTEFSDKSIRTVVIAIPLPILKKHGLHMGQSIAGKQTLSLMNETLDWIRDEKAKIHAARLD